MNSISVGFRYRARADESIEDRRQQVMNGLLQIEPPWGLKGQNFVPVSDIGADLCVQVNLSGLFGADMTGGLSYLYRSKSYLRDEAQFDDWMIFRFKPGQVDYSLLVRTAFPQYIQAFQPYRGSMVLYQELDLDDWEEIKRLCKETGKDVDGRDGVYRINSVNYFDQELCRRAFNLSPEEIVNRLQGKVEQASIILNGVFLLVTSEFVDRSILEKIDETVRSYLLSGA